MLDPLWNPGAVATPAGIAAVKVAKSQWPLPPALWRAAQVMAAPELNGMTAPGAWAGLPWFVPGPVAGAPYYA